MDKLPEESPAARASRDLLQRVRAIESAAATSEGFDPWAVAEAELRVQQVMHAQPRDAEALRAACNNFRPLQVLRSRANAAFKGPELRSPIQQTFAARLCLELRKDIEHGDGGAVLDAVARCAAHGLVMPGWLAAAFLERWQSVANGVCRDWSDSAAFGPALRKGGNVAGLRLAAVYGPWAYEVAIELLIDDPNRAIDRGLYEEVGERIGRSHSQVFNAIRAYLKGAGPPLQFVRDRLREGMALDDVSRSWQEQEFKRVLRKVGAEPTGGITFREE